MIDSFGSEVENSRTERCETACGTLFIRVTFDDMFKPHRIFIHLGKGGSCQGVFLQYISSALTRDLLHDVGLIEIQEDLKDNYCLNPMIEGSEKKICMDRIAEVIEKVRKEIMTGEILKVADHNQTIC